MKKIKLIHKVIILSFQLNLSVFGMDKNLETQFSQFWKFEKIESNSYDYWDEIAQKIKCDGVQKLFTFSFPFTKDFNELNSQQKKLDNLWPAIEINPFRLSELYFDYHLPYASNSMVLASSRLKRLGYNLEAKSLENENRCFYSAPDVKTLSELWQHLRKEMPSLPILNIMEADESVLSDLDFIKAYINNHIVISNKEEFLHDHMAHAMPTLFSAVLNPTAFKAFNKKLVIYFKDKYEMLILAPRLMPALEQSVLEKVIFTYAILLDMLTSQSIILDSTDTDFDQMIEKKINYNPNDNNLLYIFWEKRFKSSYSESENDILLKTIKELKDRWALIE